MKKAVLLFALVLGLCGIARADDPATPAPVPVYDQVAQFIKSRDPQAGTYFNIKTHAIQPVITAALYEIKSKDITIGDLRGGIGLDKTIILGPSVDVAGLGERFLPKKVTTAIDNLSLPAVKGFIRKYFTVSLVGSYGWDHDEWGYGVVGQGKLTF